MVWATHMCNQIRLAHPGISYHNGLHRTLLHGGAPVWYTPRRLPIRVRTVVAWRLFLDGNLLFVVTHRVENAAHGDAIGVHLFGPGVAATAFRDAIPVVACILGWWLVFLSWVPSNHDCRAYTTPPVARARKQLAKIAPWAFRHNNSEGIKTHQHVIQTPSKVIHEIGRKNRGHQNPSKPHQKSSEHHQNPSHDNSHQTSPKVIGATGHRGYRSSGL